MPNNNKIKGNNSERELAKILTEVFGKPFLRVPTSGAMTGGKNQIRTSNMEPGQIKSFSGDIICPDGWNLSIECKSCKSFPFHMLTGNQPIAILDKWIEQASISDSWLLCFKVNRIGWRILARGRYAIELGMFKMPNHSVYQSDYVITELIPLLTSNPKPLEERWLPWTDSWLNCVR
jgi:Holliday junction resolvase